HLDCGWIAALAIPHTLHHAGDLSLPRPYRDPDTEVACDECRRTRTRRGSVIGSDPTITGHTMNPITPISQSQGDCVLQPRVARNELPWVDGGEWPQPQRGCGEYVTT